MIFFIAVGTTKDYEIAHFALCGEMQSIFKTVVCGSSLKGAYNSFKDREQDDWMPVCEIVISAKQLGKRSIVRDDVTSPELTASANRF